ncbi:MAG: hypothetical protein JWM25_1582 [Thermoleophilia bacterium]|nr:hypothetical protein [Thermoleophilia bacterium]
MTRLRLPMLIVLLLAAAVCAPTAALAVDVTPQAVEDPPAAFVEEEPAAPVTPAPVAPVPDEPTGETPDVVEPIASVAAGQTAEIDVSATTPATLPRAATPRITGSGSLPFTGVDLDRNAVMLAIGFLLVVAGGLLFAVPRSAPPARSN